ncbi:MAG: phage holin [Eubacteriales bacterium]|nr:phage holin [Eubacteriales bacterium]
MHMENHTIGADTIARTIILVLALVNQILAIAGHAVIPFTDNDIYQLVSVCWTAVAALVAWWKNNSFTCLACEADAWRKKQQEQKQTITDKKE